MSEKAKSARPGALKTKRAALDCRKDNTKRRPTQYPDGVLRADRPKDGSAPLWTWSAPGLTPTARLLLSYLWTFVGAHDHTSVWPSQQTLAERLGLSEWNVRKLLSALQAHGYLEKRYRIHADPGFPGNPAARLYVLKSPQLGQTVATATVGPLLEPRSERGCSTAESYIEPPIEPTSQRPVVVAAPASKPDPGVGEGIQPPETVSGDDNSGRALQAVKALAADVPGLSMTATLERAIESHPETAEANLRLALAHPGEWTPSLVAGMIQQNTRLHLRPAGRPKPKVQAKGRKPKADPKRTACAACGAPDGLHNAGCPEANDA